MKNPISYVSDLGPPLESAGIPPTQKGEFENGFNDFTVTFYISKESNSSFHSVFSSMHKLSSHVLGYLLRERWTLISNDEVSAVEKSLPLPKSASIVLIGSAI